MKQNWIVFSLGAVAGVVLESIYMKGYVHDFFRVLNQKIDSMFD